MTSLKVSAVGIVAAVLFGAGWLGLHFRSRSGGRCGSSGNQGAGLGASSVGSGSVLLAALIGFILGFTVTVRRASN
jgi:hypothetical protein